MAGEQLLLLRHQSTLRFIGEAEALGVLTQSESLLPRRDIEIDTRPFAEEVEGGYWAASHAYLREMAASLREAADAADATRTLYFGIAEIPHVIALGAYLGDERYVEVHDYDRDLHTWSWRTEAATLQVESLNLPQEHVPQPGPAVIRLEISYPIADEDVDAVIGRERIADVRIRPAEGGDPSPTIVLSAQDVGAVRREFRKALQAILEARPATETIHLFVAAPVSVCFVVGQELRLRNGRDVQTYRYRRVGGEKSYKPAILLTSGTLREVETPLTDEELELAGRLRDVWQRSLEQVMRYAGAVQEECADTVDHWYDYLRFHEAVRGESLIAGLRPIWELVDARDTISPEPRHEDYAFDKDAGRVWRLSDRLLLGFYRSAERNEERMQELVRLFLFHEYLHDWQDLTKYTAEDVGSFANCLERIDYLADTYAILHHLDLSVRSNSRDLVTDRDWTDFLRGQVDLILRSFWAFEPVAPHYEWQERRLRRYLNWFWRRVQLRDAPSLQAALRTLLRQPVIEVAGLQYRTGRGRIYVVLNEVRLGDVLEIGLVLEDGRFFRRGSSTDLGIAQAMEAFARHDHEELGRFFNSLYEHVRQTGGELPLQ